MRAIIARQYGPPSLLRLEERPIPEPGPGQVRVAVKACSLNAADWHLLCADPFLVRLMFGLFKPNFEIPGCDLAGVVDAVGQGVTRFKVGDEVMGELANHGLGAFADLALAPEQMLAPKPAHMNWVEAAATPLAGVTALQALRTGQIKAGERLAINGASGGVGNVLIQIAKAEGAHVTAICSGAKVDQAKALGADEVIDYKIENFTERIGAFDLIIAANGYHPMGHYKRALAPGGRFVMVGGEGRQMFAAMTLGPLLSLGSDRKLGFVSAKSTAAALSELGKIMEKNNLRPFIDRTYPLAKTPEAMDYLYAGHARGKIALDLSL